MTEEQLAISAFFHDWGKFLERAKELSVAEDIARQNVYAHVKYSAQFVRAVRESAHFDGFNLRGTYLGKMCTSQVEELVLFHHVPQSVEGKILQLADWLQAAEREERETPEKRPYYQENLRSPVLLVDRQADSLIFFSGALDAGNPLPS